MTCSPSATRRLSGQARERVTRRASFARLPHHLDAFARIPEHRPEAPILWTVDHPHVRTALTVSAMPADALRRRLGMIAHQADQVMHADVAQTLRDDLRCALVAIERAAVLLACWCELRQGW